MGKKSALRLLHKPCPPIFLTQYQSLKLANNCRVSSQAFWYMLSPKALSVYFFLLYFVVSWYMVTKWIINVSLQIAKSYCFNPILHLSSFGSKTEATTNIQLNDRHVQNITKHHIRCTYEWKISSSYEQMCSKKDLGGKDVLNFWL